MKQTIGIIGCGAWASTVTCLFAEQPDIEPLVWCHEASIAEAINTTHKHPQFELTFPAHVQASHDLQEVVKASQYLVLGVASPFLSVLTQIVDIYNHQPILILTKGVVEDADSFLVSDNVRRFLPQAKTATLSGPNLASEIQHNMPAATVIASTDIAAATAFQTLLSCKRFRVYTSTDQRGVELGGVLKNYIAVACGISEGLNLGVNCRSAIITRGLTEMIRLGTKLGGQEQTFCGLSGIGDLITTCSSPSSRNYRLGHAIATGSSVQDAVESLQPQVAEGYKTTRLIHRLGKDMNIDLPLVTELYNILYENKSPLDSMMDLTNRPLKQE